MRGALVVACGLYVALVGHRHRHRRPARRHRIRRADSRHRRRGPVTTRAALDAYAAIVAASSSAIVQRLRPGLTNAAVVELEQAHDVVLPDEARAIWTWRDGGAETRPGTFVASGRFLPLAEGIAADRGPLASRRVAHADPRPGAVWVQLLAGMGLPLCVEVQGPSRSVVLGRRPVPRPASRPPPLRSAQLDP